MNEIGSDGSPRGHKNINVDVEKVESFPLNLGGDTLHDVLLGDMLSRISKLEERVAILEENSR